MQHHEMHITVTQAHTDSLGRLKASAILGFAQDAAEAHCQTLGLDWNTLQGKGLFWAILRYRLEITRLPRLGEALRLETWPLPTTRSAFPRATAAYDQAGNLLFRVLGLWALVDTQTRAMVLPGKSQIALEGLCRGNELPAPTSLPPLREGAVCLRHVTQGDTDRNGHMNNAAYLGWLDQLLSQEFRKRHTLTECVICYLSEATLGQEIALTYQLFQGSELLVDGHRTEQKDHGEKTRVFAARMRFSPVVL